MQYGEYCQKFSVMSKYLKDKHQLLDRDISLLYLRGFPTSTMEKVSTHLSQKSPDVLP